MAHGNDTALGWEWDSVLLLANPILATQALEGDGNTPFPDASVGHNHNHDQGYDKYHVHESSSAELLQTDSVSSGSQQTGANQCRDPRLDCPNFLAGRVPCACTDNDDDDSGVSRKRSKPVPRCQVQLCGAELTNLKGYHQRHRVCLRCAHATRVMLRNQPHRYCQQCGKFHPICDFDEGKRSCRRKLERHNNRRRRKALDSEDMLPPLDGSEFEARYDSSPINDGNENTPEVDDKASRGRRARVDEELALPPLVRSPSEKRFASQKKDTAGIVALEGVMDVPLEALAPTMADRVEGKNSFAFLWSREAVFPTSEPPSRSSELVNSPELQRGHKKDCLPHPDHFPISRDSYGNETRAMSNSDMSSHHIAARDPEEAERVVRGNDEESLLALLMEDSSVTEVSGMSQNVSGQVNGAPQFWGSSTPSLGLSKQAGYSSPNPTGRISFKLYDWNPGDFPRHLRQQVMHWLSQMPVDLEGYIRSGCTILTLFVSMPQPAWEKLNADWTESVLRLVQGQGGAFDFWNTGYLIARVGQQIVHIGNGEPVRPLCGRSERGPVLEGVHPICVEAGAEQVVELVGSCLHPPESKFLFSFDGAYVKNEILSGDIHERADGSLSLQAKIPALHSQKCGTAFIEVEHSSGVSNFIPLLIAEKDIVDEVRTLELEVETPTTSSCCSSGNTGSRIHSVASKKYHDLLVDLGWVLRYYTLSNTGADYKPILQDFERLRRLLHFGVRRGWCRVVERVLDVAKRAGLLNNIGFLNNGMTALHVALLHQQYAVMDHLIFLTASCTSSGLSGCWWDVDCPVPDGMTARQILVIQANASCLSSTNFEKSTIFRKMVGDYVGDSFRRSTHNEERMSSERSISEVQILIPSDADICSEGFEYRALPGETSENIAADVSVSRTPGEARFAFPSVNYSVGKISDLKLLLSGGSLDTRLNSCVPYKRSRCSVDGLNLHVGRASKRKTLYVSMVGAFLVCTGLCVMLKHPNQVIELSTSLRRCLWGFQDGPL
ncbi:hypothetical protein R1sor_009603 [Riccia sorocarpa]|uniref:SBP-type domain-containing protein n=1 Tax=Riccia sorocarpa TaxID=122646 RepID=A0ABD3HYC2_9MARC